MIDEIPGDLLQWLRGFYFVADRGSITKATSLMGRMQPTISRQIRCLEKELGVTLFDRSSGKMKLTAEGRVLLKKTISLFEDVREIRTEFKKDPSEYHGKVFIAASHAIIDSFLPSYITKFRSDHARVTFHLQGGFFPTVHEQVESGEADFGISIMDHDTDTIECHDLFETGQLLIAPKGRRFFPEKQPTLQQIANVPIILFSRTGSIEPFIESIFAKEQLQPNVVMTLNNFTLIKKYVGLGMGAALMNDYGISPEDDKNLEILSVDQYFPKRKVGLLLRKRKYLSPTIRAFIRTIKPDIQFHK